MWMACGKSLIGDSEGLILFDASSPLGYALEPNESCIFNFENSFILLNRFELFEILIPFTFISFLSIFIVNVLAKASTKEEIKEGSDNGGFGKNIHRQAKILPLSFITKKEAEEEK